MRLNALCRQSSTKPFPTVGQVRAQSQSSYRGYRSILSTSLDYVISLTKGFAPWRPVAEWGTVMGPVLVSGFGFGSHFIRAGQSNVPNGFSQGSRLPNPPKQPRVSHSVFLRLHRESPTRRVVSLALRKYLLWV